MKLVLLGALAAALSMTRPCLAGDAAAEALFRAGREAAEKGDHATACARFEESHRLEPAAGTVFNLALCYEKRGQIASAWTRFREAKDRLASSDERVRLCDERIAALEPRLPRLTLSLGSDVPGATVTRDGVELGSASLGVAVPVDPGNHEIVVRAPGHAPRTVTLSIEEGRQKEVVLEVGPAEAAEATPVAASPPSAATEPPPKPPEGSSTRTLGYVIGGVGVAGIAASLGAGALVIDRKNTVERECNGSSCSQAGVDAADSGRALSTISTVAFAAGAVGVGVGLYLVLSSKDGGESARLELAPTPGGTSLRLGGRF